MVKITFLEGTEISEVCMVEEEKIKGAMVLDDDHLDICGCHIFIGGKWLATTVSSYELAVELLKHRKARN